jgi:excisionase family DNA binding protein
MRLARRALAGLRRALHFKGVPLDTPRGHEACEKAIVSFRGFLMLRVFLWLATPTPTHRNIPGVAMLTKKQVIERLGVSERSITNYVKSGRLRVKYVKGKFGQEARFSAREVDALAIDLTVKPEVISVPLETTPLAKTQKPLESSGNGKDILPAVATGIEALMVPIRSRPLLLTEIAVKPLLKLEEASVLTGLSRERLRDSIREGDLKASVIGRSWRVKRKELDRFIESL